MRQEDNYFSGPEQLKMETFKLKLAVMKREMETAGVLNVEIDSEYLPVDDKYMHESDEELFYDSFINTHTFLTSIVEDDEIYDEADVFRHLGKRFDFYVDELSGMFKQGGDQSQSITVQNLTLQGAADFAKKRYDYYLSEFINNEVSDVRGSSQDVLYWSWAHAMLDHASQLPVSSDRV